MQAFRVTRAHKFSLSMLLVRVEATSTPRPDSVSLELLISNSRDWLVEQGPCSPATAGGLSFENDEFSSIAYQGLTRSSSGRRAEICGPSVALLTKRFLLLLLLLLVLLLVVVIVAYWRG
jgi:hypothetical protein